MSVAVMPFSLSFRALAVSASSTLRGRPPMRPSAAAAASPARVRSIMVSRSSWADHFALFFATGGDDVGDAGYAFDQGFAERLPVHGYCSRMPLADGTT